MKPQVRRRIGGSAGVVAGLALAAWLHAPGQAHLRMPGPLNTGHAGLACDDCHQAAPGSVRQQLQNTARAWLGLDAAPVDVGYRAVGNAECTGCHERPDDRHPTFRFLEPRFAAARAELQPEQCAACHAEHRGTRTTIADAGYCRHCHGELAVERDPLDVPHAELVRTARWDSCLGCHDYHGNHALQAPVRLDAAISPAAIRTYLDGGPSPYPPTIRRARSAAERGAQLDRKDPP